jgi:Flp pilus assembly protein TadG
MIRAMKLFANFTQNIRHRLGQLPSDEHSNSAVEFALLPPLMVTLYLGSVEISQVISSIRKVTLTSRTVADFISQLSSINEVG